LFEVHKLHDRRLKTAAKIYPKSWAGKKEGLQDEVTKRLERKRGR
jgi:hypothetical protein